MAGERSMQGVLAGVPVPVPGDLVMLLLGERVSAGALPLWLAAAALEVVAVAGTAALFLAARGPGRALLGRFGPRLGLSGRRLDRAAGLLERRGWAAMATGRTTPGLRTVTVVAAASSGIRVGRALPALVLGSSLFLQAHLLLGYALGPAAGELLERARLPVLVVAAVALAAAAALLLARRRGRAARVLAEGACPACLTLGLLGGAGRPVAAPESPEPDPPPARTGRSARPTLRPGAPVSGGRRYTSRLASSGVPERSRPDLSGQSRPPFPGDCWTCSTAGEPPVESGDLPELLSALVANSTTASPASTVATRMARQGRHPVRAAVTGSSGKRASFSRRP